MELDFGGVGKEFAADRAAEELLRCGIERGMVNLGGDVRVLGPRQDGSPWAVGIAHPRKKGLAITTVSVMRGAVATSGDYERYFEKNGERYCHILNPRTGYPVTGIQGVSVLAESCLVAGSFCTVAMLFGAVAGREFLDEAEVGYLMVLGNGEVVRNS